MSQPGSSRASEEPQERKPVLTFFDFIESMELPAPYGGNSLASIMEKPEDPVKRFEKIDLIHHQIDAQKRKEIQSIVNRYKQHETSYFKERRALIRRIPKFWSIVITTHPDLLKMMSKLDCACLHHLIRFSVDGPDCMSFKFRHNPYFKNSKIEKKILTFGHGLYYRTTTIEWINRDNVQLEKNTFLGWLCNDNHVVSQDWVGKTLYFDVWNNCLSLYMTGRTPYHRCFVDDPEQSDGTISTDSDDPFAGM